MRQALPQRGGHSELMVPGGGTLLGRMVSSVPALHPPHASGTLVAPDDPEYLRSLPSVSWGAKRLLLRIAGARGRQAGKSAIPGFSSQLRCGLGRLADDSEPSVLSCEMGWCLPSWKTPPLPISLKKEISFKKIIVS